MDDNQSDFHRMSARKMSIDGDAFYADTKDTQIEIYELHPNVLYMFVVKAANQFGEHLFWNS